MTRPVRAVLLAWLLAAPSAGASGALVIQVTGDAPPELRRGIEFGLEEASRTAGLLGVDVRLAGPEDVSEDRVDGILVAAPGAASRSTNVPSIHISAPPAAAGLCDFSVAMPQDVRGEGTVRWHHSLNRFGASELNERFSRRYSAPMGDLAWAGWVAVKALVESALRNPGGADPCAALAGLRFDGHKGRPLHFDPRTRVLSQPLYTLRNDRVVGESK